MIITVTKATWLKRYRVTVKFTDGVNEDTSVMTYDDLQAYIVNTPNIVTDVFWMDKSHPPPAWFIEHKRWCVLKGNDKAKELFGLTDVDLERIAAIFTNDMTQPADVIGYLTSDATPEAIAKVGLVGKGIG